MSCQHCQSNKQRKYVFVLQDEEGNYIQVGKACLKDFTDSNYSAESIAKYFADLDVLYELTHVNVDEGFFTSYKEEIQYSVREVIGFSIYLTDIDGYVTSTEMWKGTNTKLETFKLLRTEDSNEAKYKEAFDKVDEVIEHYQNAQANNDYISNLKVLLSEDYIIGKHIGYVVSAYNSMLNAKRREAERKQKEAERLKAEGRAESEYVGEVGQRQEFKLEYSRSLAFDGFYGTTYMHFFFDENDNVFVWSTSKWIDLEQGEQVTATATIKEHKEYRDVKQTVLTRCKIK